MLPEVGTRFVRANGRGSSRSVEVDQALGNSPVPALRPGLVETVARSVDEILDHLSPLE